MPEEQDRDRYARRAAEVRALLRVTQDPDAREALEQLAASYDHLVEALGARPSIKMSSPKITK